MIKNLSDFKIQDIILYDPYEDTENIVKVDISTNKNQTSILIKLELPVLSVNDKNIMLSIKDKEYIKTFFNELDGYFVNNIQEKKITKKLKTKFNYIQLLSGGDILTLTLNFSQDIDYPTQIFQNKKVKLNSDDMLSLLKNNGRASVIFELKSIIFNKKDGTICLDNLVRQMKVKKLKPKRIENIKYSFVDTEESHDTEDEKINEKTNKKNNNDDDCLINNINDDDDDDDDNDDEQNIYLSDEENIKNNNDTSDDELFDKYDNNDIDSLDEIIKKY